jgi:hypothetical protein
MSSRKFLTSSPPVNVISACLFKCSPMIVRDFGEVPFLQNTQKSLVAFVQASLGRIQKSLSYNLGLAWPTVPLYYNGQRISKKNSAPNQQNDTKDFAFKKNLRIPEEHAKIPVQDQNSFEKEDPQQSLDDICDPEGRSFHMEFSGLGNFAHGIPHFAVAVSLEQDGACIAGVIFDPLRDEIFWTHRARGAFLERTRLRVTGRKLVDRPLLGLQMPQELPSNICPQAIWEDALTAVGGLPYQLRCLGSLALDLAYVASGRLDGFLAVQQDEKLRCAIGWRLGQLMIQESRGILAEPVTFLQSPIQYAFLGSEALVNSWMDPTLEKPVACFVRLASEGKKELQKSDLVGLVPVVQDMIADQDSLESTTSDFSLKNPSVDFAQSNQDPKKHTLKLLKDTQEIKTSRTEPITPLVLKENTEKNVSENTTLQEHSALQTQDETIPLNSPPSRATVAISDLEEETISNHCVSDAFIG